MKTLIKNAIRISWKLIAHLFPNSCLLMLRFEICLDQEGASIENPSSLLNVAIHICDQVGLFIFLVA